MGSSGNFQENHSKTSQETFLNMCIPAKVAPTAGFLRANISKMTKTKTSTVTPAPSHQPSQELRNLKVWPNEQGYEGHHGQRSRDGLLPCGHLLLHPFHLHRHRLHEHGPWNEENAKLTKRGHSRKKRKLLRRTTDTNLLIAFLSVRQLGIGFMNK